MNVKVGFLVFIICSLGFLNAKAQTVITGYLPLFKPEEAKKVSYTGVSHVLLAFGNPNEKGDLFVAVNLDSLVNILHQQNKKVLVSLGGGGDYSFGKKYKIYQNLISNDLRSKFISKLIQFAKKHNLDGYDLNLEGKALMLSNYTSFVTELSRRTREENLELLGTYFTYDGHRVDSLVIDALDFVQVMSYSGVGFSNYDKPQNVNSTISYNYHWNYWTKRVPKNKIIMGLPLYAPLFPLKNAGISLVDAFMPYCDLEQTLKRDLYSLNIDSVHVSKKGIVFFNNEQQIVEKLKISSDCAGYMFWEISQDSKINSYIIRVSEFLLR